jgi:DNA polymerase-3 subunit beta
MGKEMNMRFSINKIELVNELGLFQGILEKKNTIPMLSNVLIEAKTDTLLISATDLDVALTVEVEARVEGFGSGVVSGRKFFDIVRNLPDAEIEFGNEKSFLTIKCGESAFKLAMQEKIQYPTIPDPVGKICLIKKDVLGKLFAKVVFAITKEESRYTLNGCLLEIKKRVIRAVATDGHRLAIMETDIDSELDNFREIVPKKAAVELQRILQSSKSEDIEFRYDQNHLFFRIGRRLFSTRMLSGQFPNYEMILPKDHDKELTVENGVILSAIRRSLLMSDDRSHAVMFTLQTGCISLNAESADLGSVDEKVPVEYVGNELRMGFNGNYFLDALAVMDSGDVRIELKDENSAAKLIPAVQNGFRFTYLVMPCRLL